MSIFLSIGSGHFRSSFDALPRDIAAAPPTAAPLLAPDGSGLAGVCALVEQVEGVRFGELLAQLAGDQAPAALAQVLSLATRAGAIQGWDRRPAG